MKIKDTTETNTSGKRHKTSTKPGGIKKATAKKVAMRAGHLYVSGDSVARIRGLYKTKIAEMVRKLDAVLEACKRNTVKTADVKYVAKSDQAISGVLPAN
jgi:histone H3/H4